MTGKTNVKICGITDKEVGNMALKSGADMLGFIVEVDYSRDTISRDVAKELISGFKCDTVLVTVEDDIDDIAEVVNYVEPTFVQISAHIRETSLQILKRMIKSKIIYTIHVEGTKDVERAIKYSKFVDMLLLDTASKGIGGGTGKIHDWEISKDIVQNVNVPVVLAGGLHPANVAEAVGIVCPAFVDVNSGVKVNMHKDPDRIKAFITEVKGSCKKNCSTSEKKTVKKKKK